MKAAFACSLVTLCFGLGAAALADAPPAEKPLVINSPGTFQDEATWEYQTADKKYTTPLRVKGTNETLVMPSPSPPPGGTLYAVVMARHRFDTLGYPLHIGLVEKLFAASFQIGIFVYDGQTLWSYDYGAPAANERDVTKGTRPAYKAWGPYHADSVPLAQAPEPEIQAAFDFAKSALTSITNMPAAQKDLTNYGVLFIDDGNTIWVELGPRFAPEEVPHLGCQTQLGRDMVFGYNKKQPQADGPVGKFLQCF